MLAGAFTASKLPQLIDELGETDLSIDTNTRHPSCWHAVTVSLQFPAGGLL
jgi:hypothetical protein